MKFRAWHVVIAIVVVAGSFGLGTFLTLSNKSIPDDFRTARVEGGRISGEIVTFLNDSLDRLDKISELDEQFRFSEARAIVKQQQEAGKHNDANSIALANQLEIMARTSITIRPTNARDIAVSGISQGVALVSRLVAYNDTLDELFATLDKKFQFGGQPTAVVAELLHTLNEHAVAINQFNNNFNAAFEIFDRAIGE